MATTVLVYRDLKAGKMMAGSARIEEYESAPKALDALYSDGWRMSGNDCKCFFKNDSAGYILHECRLIF